MNSNSLNFLFVTGMGRSGTTFLANLLSNVPETTSGHEQIGNREFWLLSWYLGAHYSIPFLEREKLRIESENTGKKLFVDVNSYLQNSVPELTAVFGKDRVLHLVRDPKEVVRSIYTRRNDNDIHLLPKEENEVRKWLEGDRFYQVCWNWKAAMQQLVEQQISTIKFESLTSDYAYTKANLLDPFNISLSEESWNRAKNIKANKTPSKGYRYLYSKLKGKQFQADELGKFEAWPENYKNIFNDLCGDYSHKLGY